MKILPLTISQLCISRTSQPVFTEKIESLLWWVSSVVGENLKLFHPTKRVAATTMTAIATTAATIQNHG